MNTKLLLEEEQFQIARSNLSMIAMILTFLGGFALAALLELPQAFQALKESPQAHYYRTHPDFYLYLETLLVIISNFSLLGALVSTMVYIFAGGLQNCIRKVIYKRYDKINMTKLLGDYSLYIFGRTIAYILTCISLGIAIMFLISITILDRRLKAEPIIILGTVFLALISMIIARQFLLPYFFRKKVWQFGNMSIMKKDKTRIYSIDDMKQIDCKDVDESQKHSHINSSDKTNSSKPAS